MLTAGVVPKNTGQLTKAKILYACSVDPRDATVAELLKLSRIFKYIFFWLKSALIIRLGVLRSTLLRIKPANTIRLTHAAE
jgi:hypothetical protein